MTTNHSEESDDEFRLDSSLQSFEQSLRQHEPRSVELDAVQLLHRSNGWSGKSVTISPLSFALSCGGSALAGAAVVLLIFNTSFDATVIDSSSKQSNALQGSVQAPPIPVRTQSEQEAIAEYVDVKNLTAGKLRTHPELAQLAWRFFYEPPIEAEPPPLEISEEESGINLKPNTANMLFNLNRGMQL